MDSIADSDCGLTAMEEGEMDATGDEEVEGQDEGATAGAAPGAAPEAGVANITWDPEDPFFEFTDKSSSTAQTPVAVSTPVSMPTKETMPGLKEPSLEEP